MRFHVKASVGNANGVFDAAYDFGSSSDKEAEMSGTPQEIGQEVARFLALLTPEDCQVMRYGTPVFFIQLTISPEEPAPEEKPMDPQACLQAAEEALAQGDLAAAQEHLNDYQTWRRQGGFEPPGGDASAQQLAQRLHQLPKNSP